jgi:hypothetical protein
MLRQNQMRLRSRLSGIKSEAAPYIVSALRELSDSNGGIHMGDAEKEVVLSEAVEAEQEAEQEAAQEAEQEVEQAAAEEVLDEEAEEAAEEEEEESEEEEAEAPEQSETAE